MRCEKFGEVSRLLTKIKIECHYCVISKPGTVFSLEGTGSDQFLSSLRCLTVPVSSKNCHLWMLLLALFLLVNGDHGK